MKENVKPKTFWTQNIQETWENMKILNLRRVRIEREYFQLKGPENILTKS